MLTQIGGNALQAQTDGFSAPLWTAIFLDILASFYVLALMIREGAPLSPLMPLAAIVSLAVIAIGIFALGESASAARIAVLAFACLIVGFASTLN